MMAVSRDMAGNPAVVCRDAERVPALPLDHRIAVLPVMQLVVDSPGEGSEAASCIEIAPRFARRCISICRLP
jgi:hypothetical protein